MILAITVFFGRHFEIRRKYTEMNNTNENESNEDDDDPSVR
jgi:hypothetical protein